MVLLFLVGFFVAFCGFFVLLAVVFLACLGDTFGVTTFCSSGSVFAIDSSAKVIDIDLAARPGAGCFGGSLRGSGSGSG